MEAGGSFRALFGAASSTGPARRDLRQPWGGSQWPRLTSSTLSYARYWTGGRRDGRLGSQLLQLAAWRRYQVAAAAAAETDPPHGIACDGAIVDATDRPLVHRPAHCYGCAFALCSFGSWEPCRDC